MTSQAMAADYETHKAPSGFVHPRARCQGCGCVGGQGRSLVRFYWKSGEELGCPLTGSQNSDGLRGLIAPRPDRHVCVWDNETEATRPRFCCERDRPPFMRPSICAHLRLFLLMETRAVR